MSLWQQLVLLTGCVTDAASLYILIPLRGAKVVNSIIVLIEPHHNFAPGEVFLLFVHLNES